MISTCPCFGAATDYVLEKFDLYKCFLGSKKKWHNILFRDVLTDFNPAPCLAHCYSRWGIKTELFLKPNLRLSGFQTHRFSVIFRSSVERNVCGVMF